MVKNEDGKGLWCRFTGDGDQGYFMEYSRYYSSGNPNSLKLSTSFHTHTQGGIQGRDFIAQ